MFLSRYLKIYPSKTRPGNVLLHSTLRGSTVLLPAARFEALGLGQDLGADGATLERLGMLVADPAAELDEMRGVLNRKNAAAGLFHAVVVLNLDCNLACAYCYEGNFRGEQYMSASTAKKVVLRLSEQVDAGKDLFVNFYGGEPLLSTDLIRDIATPLGEAAAAKGVRFGFALTTNGTLLNRELALKLLPLGLKGAKFTLDGPPEVHDRQRPYTSGAGSFDAIVDNIAAVWDLVSVQLGGNYYRDNYREFPRLLDLLARRGLTPEKLAQVLFTPITRKAGCAEQGGGCSSASEPWLVEAGIFLREEIMRRGYATGQPAFSACVVELEHNVVVNFDGSLYKCPAFMGWEGYRIGTLDEGVGDYAESHAVGNWQNEGCLACAYLPLCFGGCRFLNLLQGKSMSDIECRREIFDATLETFLNQNLAYPPRRPGPGGQLP